MRTLVCVIHALANILKKKKKKMGCTISTNQKIKAISRPSTTVQIAKTNPSKPLYEDNEFYCFPALR